MAPTMTHQSQLRLETGDRIRNEPFRSRQLNQTTNSQILFITNKKTLSKTSVNVWNIWGFIDEVNWRVLVVRKAVNFCFE